MIRAFSFGGGVQSTAALVLAAQGRIDYRLFLFSNVGDDSEQPATLAYVRDVSVPFAAANGLELVELTPHRSKQPVTLLKLLENPKLKSLTIPVRGTGGGPVAPRSCTRDFKIRVVDNELRRRGATREAPAVTGLGISMDEYTRATNRPGEYHTVEYPLMELGLYRTDCEKIILEAGLPLPPKSACWFCPYTKLREWSKMRTEEPERFERAVELERTIGDKQVAIGNDRVFLTRYKGPLDQVVQDQPSLFEDDDNCESGYCFT